MSTAVEKVKKRIKSGLAATNCSEKSQAILNFYNGILPQSASDTDERKPWYYRSYPIFIEEAGELRGLINDEKHAIDTERKYQHLIRLTAFLMSWIAGIPRANFSEPETLNAICAQIAHAEGWSLENTKFLNTSNIEKLYRQSKIMIHSETETPESAMDLKKYLKLVKEMLSSQSNTTSYNLPTVTKFLHFIHPNLFPIFDNNIYNALFKTIGGDKGENKSLPLNSYVIYIESLRQCLNDSEAIKKIDCIKDELSENGIAVGRLRVIDMVLF